MTNISEIKGYDIIGDIHGYFNELESLLKKLGYTKDLGYWKHEHRKAIFIGDFINRGPNSRKVIQTIRSMVENESGLAILGNHEINAIMYFSKRSDGRPIKIPRNSSRTLLDNFAFEYKTRHNELLEDIRWLRSLPLYLDLGVIRIVHAYWNNKYMPFLDKLYENGRLRKKFLKEAINKNSLSYTPFTETIKGIELNLPKDLVIKDSNNISRTNFRVKWWTKPQGHTFESLSFGNKFSLPQYTIPAELIHKYDLYPVDAPIVFIGHYCIGDEVLNPPQHNICCVDACVANGGKLAAYRYSGEERVNVDHFVFVKKKEKAYK